MSYSTVPNSAKLKVEPYKLQISDAELQHFQQLLKLSRISPLTYENNQADTIKFGITEDWISKTKRHWETQYDWRKRESHINSFPQYHAAIYDKETDFTFDIHFAALFSEKANAIPIVFLHGWPGSFLEFLGVLETLRTKYKPEDLPYHVIVPSLPGYTLSSGPPTNVNFDTAGIARVMDNLMTGLFPNSGYCAQGGDIGAYTCRHLSQHPACKAVHLNFSMMEKPAHILDSELSAVEKEGVEQAARFGLTQSAYALEQGTRPATIGHVLSSSPVAVLAWVGEKFLTWTDPKTTPSIDDILDSITLYWFTQSFARCIYPYREYHGSSAETYFIHGDPKFYIEQPLGYSYFPKELAPMPRSWVATTGNMKWSRSHDKGGHFAAMEQPQQLVDDVESFLQECWVS